MAGGEAAHVEAAWGERRRGHARTHQRRHHRPGRARRVRALPTPTAVGRRGRGGCAGAAAGRPTTRAGAGPLPPAPARRAAADGAHRQGVFTPDESNPDQPDYIACFGGYLYLNASMIRINGERTPGLSAEAMDAK